MKIESEGGYKLACNVTDCESYSHQVIETEYGDFCPEHLEPLENLESHA